MNPVQHLARQRVVQEALAAQAVVVLCDEERENLSWTLADVTTSHGGWTG